MQKPKHFGFVEVYWDDDLGDEPLLAVRWGRHCVCMNTYHLY